MTRLLVRARRLLSSHASALLKDAILAGLGTAATRAFLFALGVLVSRTVRDLQDFGVFSSVLLTVQLIAMFTGLGLAQTASQAIAAAGADRARQDRTVRSTLLLVLLASVVVAVALPALAGLLPDGMTRALPSDLVPAATALLAVQLAASGLEGVLRGLHRFRTLCVAGIAASVASVAFAVPLVRVLGVRGGILAATGFLALQSVLMLAPIASQLRGGLLPLRDVAHLLGVTAAPTFVNGLAWNLGMLLPPLMLARSAQGLRELALWNAAGQVRTLVSFAAVVVANAAIPRLAAAYGKPVWRREVRTSVATAMGAALATYLPVLVLARPLMGLYGAEYAQHATLLAVVASFVLLQVLGSALFVVLLSARRTWQTALLNALWAAVVLALAPRVIASGGAHALALAYLWTYGPVLVVLSLLVVRVLRTVPRAVSHDAAARAGQALEWQPQLGR
ncbi:oligosaccharide flippase family protein [Candidatus Binatia bacterium]|nr:oligosaccharide flippase family protein [Candidatus Binatia bacterium]